MQIFREHQELGSFFSNMQLIWNLEQIDFEEKEKLQSLGKHFYLGCTFDTFRATVLTDGGVDSQDKGKGRDPTSGISKWASYWLLKIVSPLHSLERPFSSCFLSSNPTLLLWTKERHQNSYCMFLNASGTSFPMNMIIELKIMAYQNSID